MLKYNGKDYVRVSDIINEFVDFGGIPQDVLNNKAALGTKVHEAICQEIRGEFPIVAGNEVGYFQSFDKWRSFINPAFLQTEVRLYDDHKMLTGCIDAIVQLQGEEQAIIIDWKTSAQESPVTWPMQAHLYHYLVKQSNQQVGNRFLFIKLDKNGDMPKVFHYKFDPSILQRSLEGVDRFWRKRNEKSD